MIQGAASSGFSLPHEEGKTPGGDAFRSYHPERRTAVVLSGTGAHGAYHAGVLRALQEAGVKIDVMAGHGVGAANAALAAIDGGSRLWERDGVWRSAKTARMYGWRSSARAIVVILAVFLVAVAGLLIAAAAGWRVPAWVVVATLGFPIGALGAYAARERWLTRRRTAGGDWWHLTGAPVDAALARDLFAAAVWELIRGAAPTAAPSRAAVGRRYADVLLENMGQPGFRELVMVATDLDARRDVVAALLRDPHRGEFAAHRSDRDRRSDMLDLAGTGRDLAVDIATAGLTPPVVSDPAQVTFAADSFWRGETHRFADRPGSISRLLEEVSAAGVTQAIVVTAVTPGGEPHRLRVPRMDPRSRLGEFQVAAEAAALRDALEMARLRFDAVYVIRPSHNPIDPFDLGGAYDEASDRRQELEELMQRAYEDAYRQFIEPVVGASGEHLARPGVPAASGAPDADRLIPDAAPTGLRDFD